MSYCISCGTELRDGAAFCTNCGKPVSAPPITTEEVAQAVVKELNREYYGKELAKTIIFAVVAVIVSQIVLSQTDTPTDVTILLSFVFAGIPSGWSIIRHILGGWTIIGGLIGLFFLAFQFGLAVMIGLFALPIKIIYYIIRICAASK